MSESLVTREAHLESGEFERGVLDRRPEGVCVVVVRRGEDRPCFDHLEGTWEIAFNQASGEYGADRDWFVGCRGTGWA